MDVQSIIDAAAAAPVVKIAPLGGGCVGTVYRVELANGRAIVAKVDEGATPQLAVEGAMLRYLSQQTALPVPQVLHSSDRLLLMSLLPGESVFSTAAQTDAAELLAALHEHSAPHFGFIQDTVIGGLPQPNPWTASWVDFFREQRLLYMAQSGVRAGRLPRDIEERLRRLCAHLEQWLLEPERPSLIHGDVWTTNVLAHNGRITGFLDPAIYYAHPEVELAFITLFNTFTDPFFARYTEIRPLQPGFYEERRDLYNLYPLLVHVRLFGGSYVQSVARTLRRFGF